MSDRQIIDLYTDLANNPEKDFGWDKGLNNAQNHNYKEEWIKSIPKKIWAYCAAVGNPFDAGEIKKGDVVLDIGCGAGVDLCVASLITGEKGSVFGVDVTPAMVKKAKHHVNLANITNVTVIEGSGEKLPFDDKSIDVVISNGAINLAPSKEQVFSEIHRVLKNKGQLLFADMIKDNNHSRKSCCSTDSWADCVAGTLGSEELIKMLSDVGFIDVQLVNINHYKTAESTVGATFSARKDNIMLSNKYHWEKIYKTSNYKKVGWYQETPKISLKLVENIKFAPSQSIIDVGCGASLLADNLIDREYKKITLFDLSEEALSLVKNRLGNNADIPEFIVGDIRKIKFNHSFDVWHDRAVFHFLTDSKDRKKYISTLENSLVKGGYAIIGTFSTNGPKECSGYDIVQYDEPKFKKELSNNLELIDTKTETHIMPSGTEQEYIYFTIQKKV